MDYVARQFLTLTKKIQKETCPLLNKLASALEKHSEAIRESAKAQNRQQFTPPLVQVTVKNDLPETVSVKQYADDARQERNYRFAIFLLTALSLGGFAIYATIVNRQYDEMIVANVAAVKSAKAAKEAADAAHDSLVKGSRPWVGIDDQPKVVEIKEVAKGNWHFVVQYRLKNFGKDVALHVGFQGRVSTSGPAAVFEQEANAMCEVAEKMTKPIYPHEKGSGPYIFPGNSIMDPIVQEDNAVDGNIKFDAIGCIVYSDQFNSGLHHTRFCFMGGTTIVQTRVGQPLHPCLINEDAN